MTIPRLFIDWRKDRPATVFLGTTPDAEAGLAIRVENLPPAPVRIEDETAFVAVFGSPILGERIAPEEAARGWREARDKAAYARGLNGQFLILDFDKTARKLVLVNDRFASIPIYHADLGDRFLASFLYGELFAELRRIPGVGLDHGAFFEFLWLQRLLGDKTYDTASRALRAASVLTVTAEDARRATYWHPDFTKNRGRNLDASAEELAAGLRRALARKTSDRDPGKRFGLFLSGGMDTRALLAAFDEPPVCFTLAFSENSEVRIAREACRLRGAAHRYLALPEDHFPRHLDEAIALTGGMYAHDHALFLGLRDRVAAEADVLLHGHGLDYMFQGMYLPARVLTLAGRPTYLKRLRWPPEGIVDGYLSRIHYRLKDADLAAYLRPDRRAAVLDGLRCSVIDLVEEARDLGGDDADAWEYLTVHGLSRHYTFPNIASKMTVGELRTPSFDNDLFELYWSLPPSQRFTAKVLRRALTRLSPALARLPSANTGIRLAASPARQTAALLGRAALFYATRDRRFRPPDAAERTWPDRDTQLRAQAVLRDRLDEAIDSDRLAEALPDLDLARVKADIRIWRARSSGGGALMTSLITLDQFLKSSA
ncbi:MAG: asparagine synthase-related protein [Alphaproteobacteria bacterium]